jgi:hypothetical protein
VYDLTPLAALLGSQEVITTNPDGQVYYYKVWVGQEHLLSE